MGQKGEGWGWKGRLGAGGSHGRGALRTTEMGHEGATGLELVQPSHNHLPAARCPGASARGAPRWALWGALSRGPPSQQPSDAHFRDGNGEAEGGGRRTAAAERPTLPDAGGRWRPPRAAARGAARTRAAGTWARAARSSCWRGRPGSPCSSPSPSGS